MAKPIFSRGILGKLDSAQILTVKGVYTVDGDDILSRDNSATTTDARELYLVTSITEPEQTNILNYFISDSILLDDVTNFGPVGVTWKPDGTKFFIVDNHANKIVVYDCSTAWDISTHTYNAAQEADLSEIQIGTAQNTAEISDIFFTPDGTRMFVSNWNQQNTIHVFDLSTAWNPSTFTRVPTDELEFQGEAGSTYHPDIRDVLFINGGLTMIIVNGEQMGDIIDNDIRYYDLSEAYNPSSIVQTITYNDARNLIIPAPAQIRGLAFGENGEKMFIVDKELQRIRVYDLSVAWDASTATENVIEAIDLNIVSANSLVTGIEWSPDYSQLYVVDAGTDTLYLYEREII